MDGDTPRDAEGCSFWGKLRFIGVFTPEGHIAPNGHIAPSGHISRKAHIARRQAKSAFL